MVQSPFFYVQRSNPEERFDIFRGESQGEHDDCHRYRQRDELIQRGQFRTESHSFSP